MRLLQTVAIVALAIFAGGCYRYNNASITSSMSDAERHAILERSFFVGMPSAEVQSRLKEMRLAKGRDGVQFRPTESGERVVSVTLRDRIYAVGIKGPGPAASLGFFIGEQSLLTRVTYREARTGWSDLGSKEAYVIALRAYEPQEEPAP